MPVNEARRKPHRERYPLEFDLEGVPRDQATREQLLQSIKANQEPLTMTQNSFISDKSVSLVSGLTEVQKTALLNELLKTAPVGREIDLSKPVIVPYNARDPRNQFPQLVYHHTSGQMLKVDDDKQLKVALKRGFKAEPSPTHDYSKVKNGVAAVKAVAAPRDEELSAEQLAELDSADEEAS
jgi:hypothetical protein